MFFDGQKSGRAVDLRGKAAAAKSRAQLLEEAKREREARAKLRHQLACATRIQVLCRPPARPARG